MWFHEKRSWLLENMYSVWHLVTRTRCQTLYLWQKYRKVTEVNIVISRKKIVNSRKYSAFMVISWFYGLWFHEKKCEYSKERLCIHGNVISWKKTSKKWSVRKFEIFSITLILREIFAIRFWCRVSKNCLQLWNF